MKKRLLLSLLAALLLPSAEAKEVSETLAARAAKAWVDRGFALGRFPAAKDVASVRTLVDPETGAEVRVVSFEGGGWVVTSADDRVDPVLAFSATGDGVDPDEGNPFWALLRAGVSAREAAAGVGRAKAGRKDGEAPAGAAAGTEAARKRWADLLGGTDGKDGSKSLSSVSDLRVDALVQARWSQGSAGGKDCWNYYTPNNYVCGCVATAYTQIMRKWCHPASSVTPRSYTCSVDGTSRSFTMKGGCYDWANMPFAPSYSSVPTDAQCEAIGRLAYDFGVTVGMSWADGGSGASLYTGILALKENFGYAGAVGVCYDYGLCDWTLEGFRNAVCPNFDAGCPVALSICHVHAVLADGYGFSGGDFYIHVNYGWAGSNDAWYCPADGMTVPSGYYYYSGGIDGIVCNISPDKTGNLLSGRVLGSTGLPVSGAAVSLSDGQTTTTDARGIYAFWASPGSYTVSASKNGSTATASASVGTTQSISPNGRTGSFSAQPCWVGNSWGNDLTLSVPGGSAPAAPARVTASDGAYTDKVLVEWASSSGATSYTVHRATSSSGTKTTLGETSSTSWNDTTATAGTTYWYWVKASNGAGTSGFSSCDTGYRAAAVDIPSAPSWVDASDGRRGCVYLEWGRSSGATSYTVYRATGSSGAKTTLGTTDSTEYYDYDAKAGTTYWYWVKASNGSGSSGFSDCDTGYCSAADPVPSAPSWVSASDGEDDYVYVEWASSTGATQYDVYRATSSSAGKTRIGETGSTYYYDYDASPGTTYYYWVTASNDSGESDYGDYDSGYRAETQSRPGNDDFSRAYSLTGSSGSTSGTSVGATRQDGEPAHYGRTTGSVWWRWTAPGNGTAVFDTDGSGFDTVLAVYTGSSVSSLSEIASNDDGGSDNCSRCEFAVTSGTTYRIAVAGWSSTGSVALNWSWASASSAPPAPSWVDASDGWDDCVFVEWGSSAGATGYDVYRSTSSYGSKSYVGWTESTYCYDYGAEPETTYYYWVTASNDFGTSGYGGYDTGYRSSSSWRPGNDDFEDAWALSGTSGSTGGSNVNATEETGEPDYGVGSVWWRWTAPGNGTAVFDTFGSDFDTKLAVYTGSWVSSLSDVACNDDCGDSGESRCEFSVSSGTTYCIAVSGYSESDAGSIVLNWIWEEEFGAPDAPAWVSASDGDHAGKVRVEWAASTGSTSYEIFRATSSYGTKSSLGTTSSTFWNDTTATAGTTYWYWVKASNGAGTSGFGSWDTGWRASGGSSSGGKFALCVGINQYSSSYGAGTLSGCVNDAKYFRRSLVELGGWASGDTTLLTDSLATKSAIRAALADYASQAVAGDEFVYVHSSHGGQNYGTSVYLCAHDDDYEDTELAADLARFRSGVKVVVIVDACHSGGLFKGAGGGGKAPFDLARRVTALLDETREKERKAGVKGVASKISSSEIGWVTAADYDQYSWDGGFYEDGGSARGGVFLTSFASGWWSGGADSGYDGDGDGLVDAYEGWSYAYDICVSYDDDFTPQYLNESVLRSVELGECDRLPAPGRPGNDDFSAAYVLSGDSGSTDGTNEGATTESGEWADDYDAEGSVWWRWTAPTTGIVRFSTEGSDFDTILSVYTGSSFGGMWPVATDDDRGEGRASVVSFRATAGTTYRIAVYGYGSNRGDVRLSWQNGFAAVHRFYSRNYRGHFFTINEGEMWNLRLTNRNWTYEGVTYLAYPTRLDGMVPVYRFFSSRYRAHFFTINEGEMWNLRRTNRNWRYEGIAYYVYPDSSRGGSPVYRFWSRNYRHHFFTTNEGERDDLRYWNRNWNYEGVAYYAMSAGYYSETGSSEFLAGPEACAAAESAEYAAAAAPADAAEKAGGPDPAATAAESSAGAAADGIGTPESCGATSADPAPAVRRAAWTLAAADGTAVAADGATKVGGTLVEACSDAPEAAELAAPDSADPGAEAASLRLELPAGAWTATLWSASGGAVADEAAAGAFAFELPADGAWRWLRVLDADGEAAYSLWLRAE